MRALLLIGLAACSPAINPGSYLCGANETCPPGQVCDGVSDSCVLKGQEMPFTCEAGTDVPGDDSAMTARQIPPLQCVSPPYTVGGCLPMGDTQDWFKLSTPSVCATVAVQARIAFPVSYQVLTLELWDLQMNTSIGTDTPCVQTSDDPGRTERCITLPVTPGKDYGLVVKPSPAGNCGGSCAYNRYDLTVQLATPG